LITALVLAVLYFALMELMLIDASRALQEAQRFRARVVALTLAESGAELAAQDLMTRVSANVNTTDFQGSMSGRLTKAGDAFTIDGRGTAIGAMTQDASVELRGRIVGLSIEIDYADHTQ
jgi:hypothetical protein